MISYGLKNFRRLGQVDPIELRPITLLIGKNSSGKSSFLRSIPLLQQSLNPTTAGAILWWGESVDFGSFRETVRKGSRSKFIDFDFLINQLDVASNRFAYGNYDLFLNDINSLVLKDIKYTARVQNHLDNPTYVSRIDLHILGTKIRFEINEDHSIKSIKYGDEYITQHIKRWNFSWERYSIFPYALAKPTYNRAVSADSGPENPLQGINEYISTHWASINNSIEDLPQKQSIISFNVIYQCLKEHFLIDIEPDHDGESTLKFLSHTQVEKIINLIGQKLSAQLSILSLLPTIINATNEYLREFINSVAYIGPARVRSERYYRKQDLSVAKISPDGTNFPMFLASLSDGQIKDLSSLVNKLYGYSLRLAKESGHVSIVLGKDKLETNLVDTGYGLSQILPVIGQMWWLSKGRGKKRLTREATERIVAIEQPELHLHPAHQATLADAFAEFSQENPDGRSPLKFLIETHSETLIERFGALIYEGKLRKEDIQIVIFDDERKSNESEVNISTFGPRGNLLNWPYGFFNTK